MHKRAIAAEYDWTKMTSSNKSYTVPPNMSHQKCNMCDDASKQTCLMSDQSSIISGRFGCGRWEGERERRMALTSRRVSLIRSTVSGLRTLDWLFSTIASICDGIEVHHEHEAEVHHEHEARASCPIATERQTHRHTGTQTHLIPCVCIFGMEQRYSLPILSTEYAYLRMHIFGTEYLLMIRCGRERGGRGVEERENLVEEQHLARQETEQQCGSKRFSKSQTA